jgi:Fe-S-cluster-containing dehydrogenase component
MSKWQLIIDVARCEGCNNCLMACKDEHVGNDWPGYTKPQQLHGDHWIRIPKNERGQYPQVDIAYRPTPCQHCDAPACASAVPGAIVKRADGIVLIDPDKAKGHKELVGACPYGAIQWNDELQVPQKCTLCAHLLDDGWSTPRCVQSCPTGALRIVKADEAEVAAMVETQQLESLHPEFNTKPSVLYANMYRYAKCFVAGNVVAKEGGTEDCVKGANIRLYRDGAQIGETTTDGFGDFRLDRLEYGETGLTVKVEAAGFQGCVLPLNALAGSINIGQLLLESNTR